MVTRGYSESNVLATGPGLATGSSIVRLSHAGDEGESMVGFEVVAENGGADFCLIDWSLVAPTVIETCSITDVTSRTASLSATVRPDGGVVSVWFEWGQGALTTTSTVFQVHSGAPATTVTVPLTGLQPDSAYHYRVVARRSGENFVDGPFTFRTTLGGSHDGDLTNWPDYYWIGSDSATGYWSGPAGSEMDLLGDPFDPNISWRWRVVNSGPGLVEFWRWPSSILFPVESFRLSAQGPNTLAKLVVAPPDASTPPPQGHGLTACWPPRQFMWSTVLEPGASVWIVDANGTRVLADTPGYYCEYAVFHGGPSAGPEQGFFIQSGVRTTAVLVRGLQTVAPRLDPAPASQITPTGATIHGELAPLGWPVTAWLEWGENDFANRAAITNVDCGAAAASLQATLSGLRAGATYQYRVTATNRNQGQGAWARQFSSEARSFTAGQAPVISTHPQSRTNLVGTSATFSVVATGTPAPAYQWRYYGAPIAGAATSALTLSNIQPSHQGNYNVLVSNALGSTLSSVAALTVWQCPVITAQPQGRTTNAGANVAFCVTASGSPAPVYQWRFNGAPLAGATSSCLTLTNAQPAAAGAYSVVLSNAVCTLTSSVATLTLPFIIHTAPGAIDIRDNAPAEPYPSVILITGQSGVVRRIVAAVHRLTHSWPSDLGVLLVGPDGQGVTLMAGAGGGQGVQNIVLTFDDDAPGGPPQSGQLVSGTYRPSAYGANHTFPLPAPPGPHTNSLGVFRGVDPNGTWALYVRDGVAGDYGSISGGWSLTLELGAPPTILRHPINSAVVEGRATSLDVRASGDGPLVYAWRKDGLPLANDGRINGVDTATMRIEVTRPEDAGLYSVLVRGNDGEVESLPATLVVLPPCTPVLGCVERLPGSGVRFELAGVVGATYVVEASADLELWKPFQTIILTNSAVVVEDNSVGLGQRYFRARTQPCASGD